MVAYLAARLCTISIFCLPVDVYYGSILMHNTQDWVEQVSCKQHPYVVSLLFMRRFLRRNPRMLFAFLAVRSMWQFYVKLVDISTPRYLAALTASGS